MHQDIGIVRKDRHSDGLSTRLYDQNILTSQSYITKDTPWDLPLRPRYMEFSPDMARTYSTYTYMYTVPESSSTSRSL